MKAAKVRNLVAMHNLGICFAIVKNIPFSYVRCYNPDQTQLSLEI